MKEDKWIEFEFPEDIYEYLQSGHAWHTPSATYYLQTDMVYIETNENTLVDGKIRMKGTTDLSEIPPFVADDIVEILTKFINTNP